MSRRTPRTPAALTSLGRVRLSRHFFLRNFLYSEIGHVDGVPNLPEDPDLAVAAGTGLATELLDPLVETFGPIEVRSAYRSATLNAYGNARQREGRRGYECASNARNRAHHIWDLRTTDGRMGACASIAVPWLIDRPARDWRDLAWWMWDHLPFDEMWMFPRQRAFNLTWREVRERGPARKVASYVAPLGTLVGAWEAPLLNGAERAARWDGFPPFRGIVYP